MSTQLLAGGDIYPALVRGIIDATEFSTPHIDTVMQFHQIVDNYYYPGWHQESSLSSLIINPDSWKNLRRSHREAIEHACHENILYWHEED